MHRARTCRLLVVAMLLTLIILPLPNAMAQNGVVKVQFGFILDGTNSMPPEDFALMVEGLASQVGNPNVVPPNGSVEICVIQVGSRDPGAQIEVYPVAITTSNQTDVANQIRGIEQGKLWTATGTAIRLTYKTMQTSSSYQIARTRVINVATDGVPYDKFKYPGSDTSWRSFQDVIDASEEAEAAGIDELSSEALGNLAQTPGQVESFRQWVFPKPAVIVPPEAIQPGFIRLVEDLNDFADVMFEKLRALIDTPTPTPTNTSTATATPVFTITPAPTATFTPTPEDAGTPTATPDPTTPEEIPEPGSLVLLATGLAALIGLAGRSQRRTKD